jgi:hypothetical protein
MERAREVTERRVSRRRRIHLNQFKARLVRAAERVAAELPEALALPLLRMGQLLALAVYFVPGVPLHSACGDLARLARARGHVHRPFGIYRRLVAQMHDVARLYHRLHRSGRESVLPHIHFRPEHRRAVEELFEQDGSFVFAVLHNPGAVLYAMRLASEFPCLIVGKRSKRAESDALLLRFFERIGVEAVLANRHERIAFTRRLLGAVAEKRAIVAPLDRIDRRGEGPTARIFGTDVSFPPWALRVAARRKLPIVPAWVTVEDGELWLELGDPIREADPAQALQGVMRSFEAWILRDPGSWAFLADKHWRRVLVRSRSVVA